MNLAQRLRNGEMLHATWHTLASVDLVEIAARAGIDCVCLDVQHGEFEFADIVKAIPRIVLAGKSCAVRIAAGEYAFAARAVDAGVDAVIAPLIDDATDAKALVEAIKYPPLGSRSWGPASAMKYAGIDDPQVQLKTANDHVLAIAMIETRAGLENLDDILAVDGIDGVLVGPADLSIALSKGGGVDAFGTQSLPAIKTIAEKTRAAKKFACVFTSSEAHTKIARDYQYQFISIGVDASIAMQGFEAQLAKAKGAP